MFTRTPRSDTLRRKHSLPLSTRFERTDQALGNVPLPLTLASSLSHGRRWVVCRGGGGLKKQDDPKVALDFFHPPPCDKPARTGTLGTLVSALTLTMGLNPPPSLSSLVDARREGEGASPGEAGERAHVGGVGSSSNLRAPIPPIPHCNPKLVLTAVHGGRVRRSKALPLSAPRDGRSTGEGGLLGSADGVPRFLGPEGGAACNEGAASRWWRWI